MSLALTQRILDTMQAWGWLQPGSVVIDPFGGRGTTAALWCARDVRNEAVTIELEPHFVEMQEANKAHAERKLGRPLRWTILQGDSRRCADLLGEVGCGVTSPPYGEQLHPGSGVGFDLSKCKKARKRLGGQALKSDYGTTSGNIGNLPDREPAAGVTSPPYGEAENRASKGKLQPGPIADRCAAHYVRLLHGNTPGQIGNLKDPACCTSPPFEAQAGSYTPTESGPLADPRLFSRHAASNRVDGYGAGVTSPPYFNGMGHVGAEGPNTTNAPHSNRRLPNSQEYGTSDGQIGALQSETYAQACSLVYQGLAEAGVRYLAVVTKNPTRDGKLRRLDKLTARLLRAAGYRIRGWRRAWLFEEQADAEAREGQGSLFGDEVPPSRKVVGRLSFFRRLHLAKGGVAAAYEDCFFAELATAGEGAAACTSPPYGELAVSQIATYPGGLGNGFRAGAQRGAANNVSVDYGSTPGQIGNLKDTPETPDA